MKKYDAKTELKNALFWLFKKDYRIEEYSDNIQGGILNFFHLADCYNALIYYNFDGDINIDLQYSSITKAAQAKAEKAVSAYIALINQGKRVTAEKILAFFVDYSKKVFESKFSIIFDINFFNL